MGLAWMAYIRISAAALDLNVTSMVRLSDNQCLVAEAVNDL
jgi:hypothetical protein